MTDLEQQLRAVLWDRHRPFFERTRNRPHMEPQNEEELLEAVLSKIPPERRDAVKELLVSHPQSLRAPEFDERTFEDMIDSQVAELLPLLLQSREGEDGPLTDDQLHRASMLQTENRMSKLSEMLKLKIEREQPGFRRDMMLRFSTMVDEGSRGMQKIKSADVTHDDCARFADQAVSQFEEFEK